MICEIIPIEGACNIRDLGGYVGMDGKALVKRRFIRAGSLSGLTGTGRKQLAATGVDCIVDLRSTMEVRNLPDAIGANTDIACYHIPMLDYIQSSITAGDFTTFPASMGEMYVGLLDSAQREIRDVFRILAREEYRTVLFHCTAGKDRTGMIAMLLLLLAGVKADDVTEDYSHSEGLTDPVTLPGGNTDLPTYLFQSRPESIQAAMGHLEEVYGGAEPYMEKIGITPAEVEALLRKCFS